MELKIKYNIIVFIYSLPFILAFNMAGIMMSGLILPAYFITYSNPTTLVPEFLWMEVEISEGFLYVLYDVPIIRLLIMVMNIVCIFVGITAWITKRWYGLDPILKILKYMEKVYILVLSSLLILYLIILITLDFKREPYLAVTSAGILYISITSVLSSMASYLLIKRRAKEVD